MKNKIRNYILIPFLALLSAAIFLNFYYPPSQMSDLMKEYVEIPAFLSFATFGILLFPRALGLWIVVSLVFLPTALLYINSIPLSGTCGWLLCEDRFTYVRIFGLIYLVLTLCAIIYAYFKEPLYQSFIRAWKKEPKL